MTKLEQAARQALVALEDVMADFDGSWALADTAITALRKALDQHKPHEECECNACLNYFTDKAHEEALAEQAEQSQLADASLEPVAITVLANGLHYGVEFLDQVPLGTKLYAAPVRTKDLTDDEIVHLVNSVWFLDELMVAKVNFARAVIAADREKNK